MTSIWVTLVITLGIATSLQGEGCNLFWQCKEHFSDKADSILISLIVPKILSAMTNGVSQIEVLGYLLS